MPRNKSWEQIRRETDLNEDRIAGYALLEKAERRFYRARERRGVTNAMMAEALGVDEADAASVEADNGDLFLAALARHVAAAGGRLELRALFDDEVVVLLSEPA
jgi:hypothetical protein